MKKRKCYVIVGKLKNPDDNKPNVKGYCDYNYADRSEMYRTRHKGEGRYYYSAESFQKKSAEIIARVRKADKSYNWEIYRVGSNKCPIEINWTKINKMNKKEMKFDSHEYHYPKYSVK